MPRLEDLHGLKIKLILLNPLICGKKTYRIQQFQNNTKCKT